MILFNERGLKGSTELIICDDDRTKWDARIKIAAYFTAEPSYWVCELIHGELNASL